MKWLKSFCNIPTFPTTLTSIGVYLDNRQCFHTDWMKPFLTTFELKQKNAQENIEVCKVFFTNLLVVNEIHKL